METTQLYILLADDDAGDRLLFKDALEELALISNIHTVNNGMQLLEYLHSDGAQLPHLIFMDLNMPRKNGLECLKEIRSDERFNDISIAIYSTSGSEEDINETFRNGANVYIQKPSDFNKLKQMLVKAVSATLLYQGPSFNRANFLMRI